MDPRFMRFSAVPLVLILLLTIAGCYTSGVPLEGAPSLAVNKAWLGTWEVVEHDNHDVRVTVRAFDEHQYLIEVVDDGRRQLHQGFATQIGGDTLLSIRNLDSRDWVFVRVRGEGDSLAIAILNKDALDRRFDSSGPAQRSGRRC